MHFLTVGFHQNLYLKPIFLKLTMPLTFQKYFSQLTPIVFLIQILECMCLGQTQAGIFHTLVQTSGRIGSGKYILKYWKLMALAIAQTQAPRSSAVGPEDFHKSHFQFLQGVLLGQVVSNINYFPLQISIAMRLL